MHFLTNLAIPCKPNVGTFYFWLALIYLKWIPSWLKLNQYKPGQNQFRSVQTSVHIGLTKSIYKMIQITLVWLLCEDKLGLANFLKLDILQNQPKWKNMEFLLDPRLFALTSSPSLKSLWHLRKKKNLKCVRSTIAILVTRNLSSSFIHAHVSLVKGKQS